MADLFENPYGTRGFAFVEYTGPDPDALAEMFERLGFTAVAKHKSHDIIRYKQGDANFLLNRETDGQAGAFVSEHACGGANAMGFLMEDAHGMYPGALERGGEAADAKGLWTDAVPCIKGIGGSVLYLLTEKDMDAFYASEFDPIPGADESINQVGLHYIDHLTHNVPRGTMVKWADFYTDLFNFKQIRYFDIEGKLTGLISKAMTSPCGKIKIPINESRDDKSQIEEFLADFNGAGIQHIAMESRDLYDTVDALTARGVPLQDTNDSYYDQVDERLPGHEENVDELRKRRILIDGAPVDDAGILLQIFSQNQIGPVFFEFIQRKGNDGFGEGNFQALFESIELDQINRGVLEDEGAN